MAATAGGLHVVGERAYCGLGWNGIGIVDAQSATNPVVLGYHKSVDQVYDLEVKGHCAFVAEGWEGITIVDTSRPAQSFYLGKVPTRGQARGVQMSRDLVFVAEAGGGLGILGLPSRPVTIFEHPASCSVAAGTPTTLIVRAYSREPLSYQWYRGESGDTSQPIAGATEPSFTTLEATQPRAYWVHVSSTSGTCNSQTAWVTPIPPVTVELLALWPGYRRGGATDVQVEGNLAYIAAGGMQIWDLADWASPRFVGSYDPKGSVVSDLCISGKVAFLACGDRGLEVVDATNPEAPVRLGSYTNISVSSVTVVGHYAYGRGGEMLRVLDIADPVQLKEVGAFAGRWGDGIAVQGGYAYLPCNADGLEIIDISDPTQPRRVSGWDTPGYAVRVDLAGSYAYVVDQPRWENGVQMGGGLVVVDVSVPANPWPVYTFTSPNAADVFVADGYAWLADGSAGLKVFNVSNPRSPMLVGSIGLTARAVMTMGQRAYVSGGDAGLQLLDISNPANPRLAGVVETAGYAQDVVVSGQYAYLADGSRGLHCLNIGDPQRPRYVSTCRGDCQSAALGSAHLFLAPFQILDVSDPAQPKAIGSLDDAGGNRAALVGDVVCLAGDSSLRTVDVASPAAPKVLASVPLTGAGGSLASWGHCVWVACDWSGLQMFDINVPTEPRRVGTYYPGASVLDVVIRGNFAYATVAEEPGLEVIDLADPQRPVPVGKVALPAAAKIALMSGGYACVTGDGLRVVDLGAPSRPVCVGHHQLGMETLGLEVIGTLAFVAVGEYGMAVCRLTPQLILQPPIQEGTDVRLSWLGGPGIRLQWAASLSNSSWQDVPHTEGSSSARFQQPSATAYFRLVRR